MELNFGQYKLRPFRRGDEASVAANISNRKIERYTLRIPYPYTQENARQWVNFNLKLARSKAQPGQLNFAMDLDGQAIGGMGLFNMNGHSAELGYWLGVKYWGKGIGTAAVKTLTKYALGELGLVRVYAKVFAANRASARVLEKAGYKYEGRLSKDHVKRGKPVDSLLFAKTR